MRIKNSKKGMSTIITIISLLFIALTFVAFLFLINQDKRKDLNYSKESFLAIDTELTLASFINSNSDINPREYGINVENSLTNGQLASMTCVAKDGRAYSKFVENANSFFSRVYNGKEKWRLELIYHTRVPKSNGQIESENSQDESRISGVSLGSSSFTIYSVMRRYESFNRYSSADSEIDAERKALFNSEAKGPRVAMHYLPCNDDATILKMVLLLSDDPPKNQGDTQ